MPFKPGKNHAFNQATSESAEAYAATAEAQHRALEKMVAGGSPAAASPSMPAPGAPPMAPPGAPAIAPAVPHAAPAGLPGLPKPPVAAMPAAPPALPGAAAKGQFFPGLTSALRKPKVGI